MSTGDNNNQDQIEDRSRFRKNDIELLNTGKFSDAGVSTGFRLWNVHKSIVCLRSGFFADRLSGQPNAAGVSTVFIRNQTERQVKMLLEFIYSGRIENIDDLDSADCVQLSKLGAQFAVDGMEIYGKKALWRKLKPYLEPTFAVTAPQKTSPALNTLTIDIRKYFNLDFKGAVNEAYGSSGKTCRLLLADFIWMARGWLLQEPIIEDLKTTYPLLGSYILRTLKEGPQSSFVRADPQLMPDANKSTSA